MTRRWRTLGALVAIAVLTAATDPDNPTCPAAPDWGPQAKMTLTTAERNGATVLLAEGKIDTSLPSRLRAAIEADERIARQHAVQQHALRPLDALRGAAARAFPGHRDCAADVVKRRGGLACQHVAALARRGRGQGRRARQRIPQRLREGRRQGAVVEQGAEVRLQRRQRFLALDGADDVRWCSSARSVTVAASST